MPELARTERLARELLFVAFSARNRVDPWIRTQLLRRLGERRVGAGEAVWTQGDMPDFVYFMRSGRLRFTRPGAVPFSREGRWVLGVQEALAATPRYRTATAEVDLTVLTLPADSWLEMIDQNPDLTRRMSQGTAAAVAMLHERLAPDGGFLPPEPASSGPAGPLSVVDRLLYLRALPFLAHAGVQSLTDLARACEEVQFEAGEIMVAAGAPRDRILAVLRGLVEARRENPTVTGRFGPGSVVGGAAIMNDMSLAWEARALEPTRALSLPLDVWRDEMDDHFDLFRSAMISMVDQRERLLDLLAARTPDLVMR